MEVPDGLRGGCSYCKWRVSVESNFIRGGSPPPLFHRIAGASAFCALRVNGLISQSALPVCGAGSRGDLRRPHACAQGQGAGPRPVVCLANFVIAFGNYAFLFISLVKEIN